MFYPSFSVSDELWAFINLEINLLTSSKNSDAISIGFKSIELS